MAWLFSGKKSRELLLDGFTAHPDQRHTVLEMCPPDARRIANIRERELGVIRQIFYPTAREFVRAPAPFWPKVAAEGPALGKIYFSSGLFRSSPSVVIFRRLFDNYMRVRAGKPKRADAGETLLRSPARATACDSGGNANRQILPGNVGTGFFEVEVRWYFLMLQRHDDFDQASNPGGGLEMADVGFDRSDHQRLISLGRFSPSTAAKA